MSVHVSDIPSTEPSAPGQWCQPVPPAPVQWWQWRPWPPCHHQHGDNNSPTAQHQCDNDDDPNATTTITVMAMALQPAWPTPAAAARQCQWWPTTTTQCTPTMNDNGPIHHQCNNDNQYQHHQHENDGGPITTPVNSPHPLPVHDNDPSMMATANDHTASGTSFRQWTDHWSQAIQDMHMSDFHQSRHWYFSLGMQI